MANTSKHKSFNVRQSSPVFKDLCEHAIKMGYPMPRADERPKGVPKYKWNDWGFPA